MALILVLEDSDSVQETIRDLFLEAGHAVYGVPTAEAALNVLEVAKPQCVIVDLHLPGELNGGDFVARVRTDSRYDRTALVVFTGPSVNYAVDRSIPGVDAWVPKPGGVTILVETCMRAIRRRYGGA